MAHSEDITKKLDHLNENTPRLRSLAPLSFWIVFVFATLNLLIGISLYTTADTGRLSAPLIIVNDILSYKLWGVLFVLLGIGKYASLYYNKWDLTKKLMLGGVVMKSAWSIALIIRVFVSPGSILVALLWFALMAIQIFTVIYFVPTLVMRRETDSERIADGR